MIDRETIEQVWQKAEKVRGINPDYVRKDACGAWIVKDQYGNRNSPFGWEIDHVIPLSLGGPDIFVNFRAMHWENNISKGDDYPVYFCAVIAQGNTNIHYSKQFTVNRNLQKQITSSIKY